MSTEHHTPAASLREEPTITELIEARERTDAGVRLAFPTLFDRSDPEPPTAVIFDGLGGTVNPELSDLIVAKVDDARVALREAMKLADAGNDRAAHIAIASEVESVSALTGVLVQRGRS